MAREPRARCWAPAERRRAPAYHELFTAEVQDDAPWAGREALAGIEAFTRAGGAYVRVQGRPDHVHGNVEMHALAAVRAAERGRAGSGRIVRGALWSAVVQALDAALLGALAL